MTQVIVAERLNQVSIENDSTLTFREEVVTLVTVGAQGPVGPPGDMYYTGVAGENLSALRVVRVDLADGKVRYADHSDITHAQSVIGITTQAVSENETVFIRALGSISENPIGAALSPNAKLYLGENGALTLTPPTEGFILCVGFVMSASKIFVRLEPAILL